MVTRQITRVEDALSGPIASPGGPLVTFLADGEDDSVVWDLGDMQRQVRRIATALAERSEPGDRALLLFPSGMEYVASFWACLVTGVVAVPVYPPRIGTPFEARDIARLSAIVDDAGASIVLTVDLVRELAAGLELPVGFRRALWLAVDDPAIEPSTEDIRRPPRDDLLYLQYTSGSTGTPAGVEIRADNLEANVEMIWRDYGQEPDHVFVSWLPIYHDMGLVTAVIEPILTRMSSVIMPPERFLQRPQRWMQAMSAHRGTMTAAPNFAYELVVSRTPADVRGSLDLSRVRHFVNGAEPVDPRTMRRFVDAFAVAGVSERQVWVGYGLAEIVLHGAGAGRPPTPYVTVDAEALERGDVIETPTGDTAREFAGARLISGQRCAIVDPDSVTGGPAQQVDPGAVGEIWLSGPHVCSGYWGGGDRHDRTFDHRLVDEPDVPWVRTGDLGFVVDDVLYVCGRSKDLIISNGRNLWPQDIERVANEAHATCRPGGAAAFGQGWPDEDLIVVQEVREAALSTDEATTIIDAIRSDVTGEARTRPSAVVLIEPRSLPKTSSGKVQRSECKRRFEADQLAVVAQWPDRSAAHA